MTTLLAARGYETSTLLVVEKCPEGYRLTWSLQGTRLAPTVLSTHGTEIEAIGALVRYCEECEDTWAIDRKCGEV